MIVRWSTGWRPFLLLSLLCLGLYLPGIAALPPTDRDEARFAQATRQMLETGDWLHIRFQNEARNQKPAGIYWLQALSVATTSDAASPAIWPYRLPSLAGAIAAILLTFALGRNLVGAPSALLGAALLAASLSLTVEAHLAKTDAALLACVVAAQLALAKIYRAGRASQKVAWPWALLFWVAIGAGALIKGPVAPLLAALTVAALLLADRQAGWLKALRAWWGMPLAILMVGPWLIAMMRATNDTFITGSLGSDFFGKVVGVQQSHGAPPGTYLLLLAVIFWPGSLFAAAGVRRAWQEREQPMPRFLLAWIVPFWVALELVPTKLPHYLLPLLPALALLAAHALFNADTGPRALRIVVAALWAVATLALAAALALAPPLLGAEPSPVGVAAGLIALGGGGVLLWRYWSNPRPTLAGGAIILALIVAVPGFGQVVPSLDRLWLSRSAAALVTQMRPGHGTPVAVVGYDEPSLIFLLGTATKPLDAAAAARYLAATPDSLVLVEARDDDAFQHALAGLGRAARALGHVDGIDYSNGKRMTLTLYAAAAG
ncbi:MAG TPA: glycosyltransferase family 39 protein [Stellaceae bacterium]|nr:glycosyltransferase family 39 protein [Stellaceae bacterium]